MEKSNSEKVETTMELERINVTLGAIRDVAVSSKRASRLLGMAERTVEAIGLKPGMDAADRLRRLNRELTVQLECLRKK